MSSKRQKSDAGTPEQVDGPEGHGHGSSGRVKFDDRGNAVWDWQLKTGQFSAETSTQRLRKLENPSLSLAEDAPTPFDKVKSNPLGTKKGYNPYDSGKLGKTAAAAKKKDLRRLSDWFKIKKQQAQTKKDGSED